ncbi:MAG: family 16 glycosylhydrolase [Phycisphaerales bacterium]|nr:MAG: family 16 glycosylhydrolase [Phycisphaerales bacterium]
MTRLRIAVRGRAILLLTAALMGVCSGQNTRPETWVRPGTLGPTPQRVTDDLPLSDQGNAGGWVRYEPMSDEFDGAALDSGKWWPRNPGWLGRQPAYFWPGNVTVSEGKLHLTMRQEEVAEMPKDKGYHTYTSAAVKSKTRVRYGYFEIKAKPMKSHGSSSFWFYDSTPEQWTEIDVFEIGGGAPGFERKYNMNVHVFRTPTEKEHWSSHGEWVAASNLADDYHVYGLEWDEGKIKWYFDGVLVRWVENTHWHQELTLNFDSETMPKWFGLPEDRDLPSTYSIEYARAWKRRGAPAGATLPDRLAEAMEKVFAENPGMIGHTVRVRGYAMQIQRDEGGDALTVQAGALLHDIGIPRAREVHGSSAGKYQEIEGPPIARTIMTKLDMKPDQIDLVCRIIANHHSAADRATVARPEFKAVWDADWLVNFPGRYGDKSNGEKQKLIDEIFKTAKGKALARSMFLDERATGLPVSAEYKLIWSDEFDGDALDLGKWDYRALGPRRDAINVKDTVALDGKGHLILTTKRSGAECHTAMIATQGKFETTFGYFEVRVKLQEQIGHWSAFWLQSPSLGQPLGDPAKAGTEIDIFEYLRKDGDRVHHNLHWDGYGEHHKHSGKTVTVPGLSAGWHTVGLLWTPDQYVFYIDGQETWRSADGVSQRDEYLILSLEVGPWAGDIANAILPDHLYVDYVRVYQRPTKGEISETR